MKSVKQVRHHIYNLYLLAISDSHISDSERQLLFDIGLKRGIDEQSIQEVIDRPDRVQPEFPRKTEDQIVDLYDFARMIAVDGIIDPREVQAYRVIIRNMGIPVKQANKVLSVLIDGLEKNKDSEELFEHALLVFRDNPSPITVDEVGRIILSETSQEIAMTPLSKALYLLYLAEDQVAFNEIADHRQFLTKAYSLVGRVPETKDVFDRISDLTDLRSNSFNVNKSRANKSVSDSCGTQICSHYTIQGRRGSHFSIPLSKRLINFDCLQ